MYDNLSKECFTVQRLIDELNKIEDKTLLVIDSANDFFEEIVLHEISDVTYVRLM